MDNRRPDRRPRPENVRRYVETATDVSVELGQNRQDTVVLSSGRGDNAVRYFALHHEDGVGDDIRIVEETEENRTGDVVRKVADHTQARTVGGTCVRDIPPENIRLYQMQSWVKRCGKAQTKFIDGPRIDFHCRQRDIVQKEQSSEHARSRTDLDDMIALPGIQYCDDFARDVAVVQKVLSERFFGTVGCSMHTARYEIRDRTPAIAIQGRIFYFDFLTM